MRRFLAIALAAIMLMGTLVISSAAASDKEVVVIWNNGGSSKIIREAQVKRFNETIGKEKNIEIQYTVYGTGYADTINLALQAEEAVDLFKMGDVNLIADYIDSGYLVALEDMPGGAELIAEYDGLLAQQREIFDGKTYSLPKNVNTTKYVINTDLFDLAGIPEEDYPTTWEEVRECAKKITEAANGEAYGFGLALGSLWTMDSYVIAPSHRYFGHKGYNPETQQYEYSDFAPLAKAIYSIIEDGSIIPGYVTLDADAVRAQFAAGKIGILGAASFDVGVYRDQFPAECNWKVIDAPSFSGEEPAYKPGMEVGNFLFIGANAANQSERHKEAVMEAYKYMYSDECGAELYEGAVEIPVRSESMELATKEPDAKGFAEFAADVANAFPYTPTPDKHLRVEGLSFHEILGNYFSGQADQDIDTMLADLDSRYNAALEEMDPELRSCFKYEEGVTPKR